MKQVGIAENYQLVDVLGLDPDLLAILPKPVLAFILLFPVTDNCEKHRLEEDEKLKKNVPKTQDHLFFMR